MPQLKKLARLAFTLALIAFLPCAISQAAQPVRVGVYNTAPMVFMEDGQAKGLFIDILRDLAEKEHWELLFVPGTWEECFNRLKTGEIDLLPCMTRTQEREAYLAFTEEFVFLDWARIFKRKGSAIRTVLDLEGKIITAMRGSTFTDELEKMLAQFGVKAYLVTKPGYAEVLDSVARGDADVGVCTTVLASILEQGRKVEGTDILFAPTKFRFGVKKGGREDLLPALDRHLAELKAQPGSLYYQLRDKWLGLAGGEPMLPRWARWAIGAGFVALCLLGAFVVALRVLVRRRTSELAKSEEGYRKLYRNAAIGIFQSTFDGRFIDVNPALAQMLGYDSPEAVLAGITNIAEQVYASPPERDAVTRAALEAGGTFRTENRYRRKDGSIWYGMLQLRIVFDAQGVPSHNEGFVSDITERKAAEEALRESEILLRGLKESIPDLVWLKDKNGVYLSCNPAFEQLFGAKEKDILGRRDHDFVDAELADFFLENDRKAMSAGVAVRNEERLVFAETGYQGLFETIKTPMFDGLGHIIGVLGIARDITERKAAEEALQQSEARYRAMVDDQTELVSRFSADGRFLFVNHGFCRFFGKTQEELIGSVWAPVVHEDDLAVVQEQISRLGPDNPLIVVENRNKMGDGRVRWVQFINRAFFDAAGELTEIQSVGRDITERKATEEALRQSEERYLATLTAVNDGLWDWHVQSGEAYFNPLYYGLLGYADKEFAASYANWRPLVHPEDIDRVEHELGLAIASGQGFNVDLRMRTRDGGWKWVCTRGKAIETDAGGKALRMVGTLSDATQRKELQASLAERELHFRILANSGQALIWTSTPDKLCNYFNEPWLAFTGRSLEQELGNGWAEGVHPDDFQRCLDIYVAAFDARERFSMEYRLRHASGEYRWIVDQGTPRYGSQGEFLGYIGHCLDINEQKQVADALRESEEKFRMLTTLAPVGVYLTDTIGNCEYVNEKWLEMWGGTLEESLGQGWVNAIHPEDRERVFHSWKHMVEARGTWGLEYRFQHLNGKITWVYGVAMERLDAEGRVVGYVGANTDITERKRIEDALLLAKEAAEAANNSKSEFLANMSHELRTPMNGVLGMLQLLMLESLSRDQQDYARKAFEAANRLLTLLNDILDFSRIEAGVMLFQQEPFRPAEILAATADVFGHICSRKGLRLDFEPDPGLPASLTGDEPRIRQIIFNLVGNAVKFTRQGSIRVEAWYDGQAGHGPGRLYFAVTDTGVGIPQDKLASVFDRFSQADGSYTRQFEGAGLGLAIVRRIVVGLRGSLCIESEPGVGTTVVLAVSAPLAKGAARLGQFGANPSALEEPVSLRILLAEDELIGQLGARLLLERMGHSVVAVGDGRAAVQAVFEGNFDCVLMDIQMPEMDGLEATRVIRKLGQPDKSGIPIVAMTAYALSGDREKFLAAGMDEYIAKPFQREELRQLLQTLGWALRQGARH